MHATIDTDSVELNGLVRRDDQEIGCAQATASLHRRLDELGIAHVHHEHPGTHTWPF